MALPLALSALQKGAALLLFTGVLAPLVGVLLKRVGGGWETMGGGPFAILNERPQQHSAGGETPKVDPAIQAAEVRQMLEAKSERRRRRGEAPLDVEAETQRLLAAAEQPRGSDAIDAELRAEVRQLVVARNERRMREGLEPLDVEAETEKQLADLIGSS
jgi:acetyl-CoA acetyltransferase